MTQFAKLIPLTRKNYVRQDGKIAEAFDALLAPDASRTTSTVGDVMEMGDCDTLRVLLDVTEKSGTGPTLDVTIETSPVSDPDSGEWSTLGTFAQKSDVSTERNVFPGADRFVRARWVIGGTSNPTFRFSLSGEAV